MVQNTIVKNCNYLKCFNNYKRTIYLYNVILFFFTLILSVGSLDAAVYKTPNFVVNARTEDFAKQVGEAAEHFRENLAIHWIGQPLPQWATPCPITVKAGDRLGAGGETTFTFANGEVYGWKMYIQGSKERILDSVLPHEISHTILASYFRKPVPRWIDEGAATSIEAEVERSNYRRMLVEFLQTGRGIPFNNMVGSKEYPSDQLPFYAQGFSVCEYLLKIGGSRRLIEFAADGIEHGNWSAALNRHYGYENLGDLQVKWQSWINQWFLAGMPGNLPEVPTIGEPGQKNPEIALASSVQQTAPPLDRLIPNSAPDSMRNPAPASSMNSGSIAMVDPAAPKTLPLEGFQNGVGTAASAEISVAASAPLRYQGSYGRGLIQNSEPEAPAPIKILGQAKSRNR
ncbi:MAG: hypothetical protein Q4G69_05440 [Planctomycetia bacterium]|nr:hypothetical protein [Planctomycetia bacterium]